jgi:hypothetical protein
MMRGKKILLGLTALAFSTFPCARARADDAADTATARMLGGDGVLLADAGDCPQAIDKLRRAETLHHAPTTAARLGECEITVGRLVEGTERLYRVLREPLGDGASPAWVLAVARARDVLQQTLPRIPTIRVAVVAPAGARFAVTLDGEPLPEATLGSDRPADPRAHRVQVTADGFLTATTEFSLTDGEAKRLSLRLEPDPNAKSMPSPQRSMPAHESALRSNGGGGFGPAIAVAVGAGVLGLAAGVGGGIYVATRSDDLSKSCSSSKICPDSKQSEISSAKTWATISTIGFAVAAGGLGTAAILLLAGHKESGGPSATAEIGPAYVGLSGRF